MTASPSASSSLTPFRPTRLLSHGMVLQTPIAAAGVQAGRRAYELGACQQLDRDHCLVIASLDEQGGGDLCVGNDAFVIRSLRDLRPDRAQPVNCIDANYVMADGRKAVLAKFPGPSGFIPLGAKRADGTDHPGAGTGFLLSACITFSSDKTSALENPESFLEMIQFRWDGSRLEIFRKDFLKELLGLPLSADRCISPFCPHEENLLAPLGVTGQGICVFSFAWKEGRWRAVSRGEPFCTNPGETGPAQPGEPWTQTPGECEPSLRRTANGFYLFTRGIDPIGRLYHSEDGFQYQLVRERPNVTVPQVLNQGLDGSLYLATNPGPGWLRNPLIAYGLDDGAPADLVLHDQDGIREDDQDQIPFVDHAISFNVLLEGRPRHLLFYRVCDLKERTLHKYQVDAGDHLAIYGEAGPSERKPTTGLYVAELEFSSVTPEILPIQS